MSDQEITFHVVANNEAQYSIWPAEKELPAGWAQAGISGTRQFCLDHINTVWTDMRPLSLQRQMNGTANGVQSLSE